MKKILALVLAAIMICGALSACGGDSSGKKGAKVEKSGKSISLDVTYDKIGEASAEAAANVPAGGAHVISVNIDKDVIALPIGTKAKIDVTVSPESAADKSLYFKSSDEKIVTVDKDGNILGMACGSAKITAKSNDLGFKDSVQVVVYRNPGDEKLTSAMVKAINDARVKNGQAELTTDVALSAAANQRAFEEAVDIVNKGEKKMDNKRSDSDKTIFSEFGMFALKSNTFYVWGNYKDADAAYKALIENKNTAAALGVSGTPTESYKNIGVGCFEFNDTTYWCISVATLQQ